MRRFKAFLLKMLTHRKTVPFNADAAESFVFLRYDRIGDLIVSLPLVKSLKDGFPNTKLILIGSEVNAPVAEYCKLFDEIVVKPTGRWLAWMQILWKLRRRKVTVVFDLNHAVTPHTILACLAINPKHAATPFKEGRWGIQGHEIQLFDLMPAQHRDGYARPLAETYLDIARLLNCDTTHALPYPLTATEIAVDSEKLILLNHTGSRSSMSLKPDILLEIAAVIFKTNPSYKILMAPERPDYDYLCQLMKNQPNVRVLSPTPTIIPIMEIVRRVAMVVTPDTALVHIASAFSKPLVAVYANEPALYDQWRPLNPAPTATIFSTCNKSLEGLNKNQLLQAIAKQLALLPL